MIYGGEGGGAGDGEEDGAQAEGDAVVEAAEGDGGIFQHCEAVGEVPEMEASGSGGVDECEEFFPRACMFVGMPGDGVAVVKCFREAEEHDEPGDAEDDAGNPVAPAPAKVFGDEAAYYGGEMSAVGYKDDVNSHVSIYGVSRRWVIEEGAHLLATLVHEIHIGYCRCSDPHSS